MKIAIILEQIPQLAQVWAAERAERQQRTTADPADAALPYYSADQSMYRSPSRIGAEPCDAPTRTRI